MLRLNLLVFLGLVCLAAFGCTRNEPPTYVGCSFEHIRPIAFLDQQTLLDTPASVRREILRVNTLLTANVKEK